MKTKRKRKIKLIPEQFTNTIAGLVPFVIVARRRQNKRAHRKSLHIYNGACPSGY